MAEVTVLSGFVGPWSAFATCSAVAINHECCQCHCAGGTFRGPGGNPGKVPECVEDEVYTYILEKLKNKKKKKNEDAKA